MDLLTFFASIITALAWPVTGIVIVIFFRKPLLSIIPEIKRLKWKGVEAEFGRSLVEARTIIDLEPQATSPALLATDKREAPKDLVLALADLSPRVAVLEAWRQVERAALEAVSRSGKYLSNKGGASASAGRYLYEEKLIGEADYQVFSILRSLRNQAAHTADFSLPKDDAIEYALMAQWLVSSFRKLYWKEGP